MVSGGQVLTTYEVDNYPGLPGIGGYDLGLKLREHADKLGAQFQEDQVMKVEDDGPGGTKRVVCVSGTYEAKALILATGAVHRKLGIPGEEEFAGMGVSYCATCDGAFFRNKVTAVDRRRRRGCGGRHLSWRAWCSKVYLIHRRDALRAAKSLQESLMALENVEILWDSVADTIHGDGKVESLSISNVKTGEKHGACRFRAYLLPWASRRRARCLCGTGRDGPRLYQGGGGWKDLRPRNFCRRRCPHQAAAPDYHGGRRRGECGDERGAVPDRALKERDADEDMEKHTDPQRSVQRHSPPFPALGVHQPGDGLFSGGDFRGSEQLLRGK